MKKRPTNRPRIDQTGPQKRRQISLSDADATRGRDLGDGNLSEGIRRAIDIATAGQQAGEASKASQLDTADLAEQINAAGASAADAAQALTEVGRIMQRIKSDTAEHRPPHK